jgi:hypothetical protein
MATEPIGIFGILLRAVNREKITSIVRVLRTIPLLKKVWMPLAVPFITVDTPVSSQPYNVVRLPLRLVT